MTDFIVEYSPAQGAFHLAHGLGDSIRANLSAIEGGRMPQYFPVAGPFKTDREADDAISRLRPVMLRLEQALGSDVPRTPAVVT